MSEEPVKAVHPTIYHVVLGHSAALKFEGDERIREAALKQWSEQARVLGKRSVEVMGPLRRLAQVDLGGEQ